MAEINNLQKSVINKQDKMVKSVEAEVVKRYKAMNNQIIADITEIYKKYDLPKYTDGKVDPAKTAAFMRKSIKVGDKAKLSRLAQLQQQIAAYLSKALKSKDNYILAMAKEAFEDSYYWNAWAASETLGISIKYPLLDDKTIQSAIDNPFSIFNLSAKTQSKINATQTARKVLSDKINREIELAIARGDDLLSIAKRMDILMGFRDAKTGKMIVGGITKKGATYDSIRIVRTELLRLFALAHDQEFQQSHKAGLKEGFDVRLQLVSTLDDRTRPQSAQMDGAMSREDGKFKYPDGGYYTTHNTGNPAWDINDREATIEVTPGYEPQLRRTKDNGIIPNMTFRSWADKIGITKNKYGQYLF